MRSRIEQVIKVVKSEMGHIELTLLSLYALSALNALPSTARYYFAMLHGESSNRRI